jgi:hypothetical protein
MRAIPSSSTGRQRWGGTIPGSTSNRLAVPARPVVVRAAPTLTCVSAFRLPSAFTGLLRQADSGPFHPARGSGASWPELLDVWEVAEAGLRFRAELSTFVSDLVCSASPKLQGPISFPNDWWRQLRSSLDAVAATGADRVSVRQDLVTRRLDWVSGGTVPTEVRVFTASHGDMHWANVTSGTCVLLDWEGWGLGPVGLDAAMLHAYSLLVPETAARVFETFADVLDTPSGRQTQLFAAAELLVTVGRGDHPELEGPLRQQVGCLLAAGGIG